MRRAAGELKDPVVVISADSNATHQSVINIMEASRMAGYGHISFATQTQNK
jgi:biopolymer transport protein ExbD